ncbi:uncharacterized protein LOC111717601 isoform X2 [Eurytemora carolleeae]|uniref:uncharacterized protein LOC111717601 isoform X2 n=1 Tax=Eurytemora carolleeae TaxID=1294199 RepID=UPI000C765561|nr:uncharacterized protein LOC111717601 isoform X2 [Eurytemora carolleeae]|eukprot:XP_023348868.1 uncharacterized protein LOC111717601 isoform X2 [Eurytemora affinis]
MGDDSIFLLSGQDRSRTPCWKKSKFLCPLLFTLDLRIMALNCWGVPGSFGAYDKEKRMVAIGEEIIKREYDVYLLEELWMRNDHATIKKITTGNGLYMTEIYELGPYGTCEGRWTPLGCSGLAIVSKYPFIETEFNVFSVHGDGKKIDGEFEARKGVGRVRIEPIPNITLDLFVTHTAASNDNSYYREIQAREIVNHVKNSTADFAILGGDFNIDPRMNETTYHTLTSELSSAMQEFFHYLEVLLSPNHATYANPNNTYSAGYVDGPQLYDYIFHTAQGWNSVVVNLFEVPFLKSLISGEGTEEVAETNSTSGKGVRTTSRLVSLSDHEAVTSHLLLYKYRT